MEHFIERSMWMPSTSVHARLHPWRPSLKPIMRIAYSPNFSQIYKFPPLFSVFLTFLASSYFDHDAFMHHALHILDAPMYLATYISNLTPTKFTAKRSTKITCSNSRILLKYRYM